MPGPNPLLRQGDLLDFPNIRPEHVGPAITSLLGRAERALRRARDPAVPARWSTVVAPLEDVLEKLGRAWGAASHLAAVQDCPEIRAVISANQTRVTDFYVRLSLDSGLYDRYLALSRGPGWARLSAERRRVIERALRDFRLAGVSLPARDKARLRSIAGRSAVLSRRFGENLLDATNAWALDLSDPGRLAGLPEDKLDLLARAARAAGRTGWRVTLQAPSYLAVMRYADDRSLRRQVHRAYATRASELDRRRRDNGPLIDRLLALRQREAGVLGFPCYGELSLATKMASSVDEVLAFLRDLAARARPRAEAEMAELSAFARERLGLARLRPWDLAWAAEKLRRERYDYDERKIRQYFPLPVVLRGLFDLAERLFGVRIAPAQAPVWHPDVRVWRLSDAAGRELALFYTDLYARASKRGGAWMDSDLCSRRLPGGGRRPATAWLVCNFAEPSPGQRTLLSHSEVETIFHEFGHGLHHMLSQVDEPELSGINGVEWDAVEMPSQFMENWTWNFEVARGMSAHDRTGRPLPRTLFRKMLAAKNFQSGLAFLRQLEFGLFDMLVHAAPPGAPLDYRRLLRRARREVAVVPIAAYDRFANSFAHIFAGGYAAGYYSYKWAEVLSADAFAAFEEEGLFEPAVGRRWLDEVLSRGSSRDALDNFIAFRGRKPSVEALLRHNGISPAS